MKNRRQLMTSWAAIGSISLLSIAVIDICFWYMLEIAIRLSTR